MMDMSRSGRSLRLTGSSFKVMDNLPLQYTLPLFLNLAFTTKVSLATNSLILEVNEVCTELLAVGPSSSTVHKPHSNKWSLKSVFPTRYSDAFM